jgi:ribosomal 30S subunit maturation factor RimM
VAPLDATQHRLAVATIVGVYGIKGWVKLRVNLSDPGLLPSLLSPQLDDPSGKTKRPVRVLSVRAQGKGYIAQLDGIDDRNQAEVLRGYIVTVPESSLRLLQKVNFTGEILKVAVLRLFTSKRRCAWVLLITYWIQAPTTSWWFEPPKIVWMIVSA